jgi:hypothetical protein
MSLYFTGNEEGWTSNSFTTYLLLRPGVTRRQMEEKLVELENTYMAGGKPHMPWIWTLEPIAGIHLDSDLATGNQPNGNRSYVRLFGWIAFLVLLIAGVNFVNLSTARSALRARKWASGKPSVPSAASSSGSFSANRCPQPYRSGPGCRLIQLALPFYRHMAGKPWPSPISAARSSFRDCWPWPWPSDFSPASTRFFPFIHPHADVLKGSALAGKRRGALHLRHVLVVFQFCQVHSAHSRSLVISASSISSRAGPRFRQGTGSRRPQRRSPGRPAERLHGKAQTARPVTGRFGGPVGSRGRNPQLGDRVEGIGRERPLT